MFESLGPFIYRYRWATLVSAGIFLLLSFAVLYRGGELTSGLIAGLEAHAAQDLADEVTHRPLDTTVVVLFESTELDARDPKFRASMREVLEPLANDPLVESVVAPETAGPLIGPRLVNGEARAAVALIGMRGSFKQALAGYPALRAKLRSDRLTITCTGHIPYTIDLGHTLKRDLLRAELFSIPIVLIVLLLVFRTIVAALVPVGVGGLSVAGGIAIVLCLSRMTDIAQYTINVCSLIGLGVAIDYSLFTVSRYREELAAGLGYPEALARAMATAGRVVVFSGIAVGAGLGGLLFFEGSYLHAMGLGGTIVVFLAVVFALTFLPALLAVLGPRIHAGRLPTGQPKQGETGIWHRTATWVMRRPILVLIPTLSVLLVAGIPFLHLRLAAADVRVLSDETEARRGYDIFRAKFPEESATRVVVAIKFPTAPVLNADRIGALYDFSRRVAQLPHVLKVQSIVDGDSEMSREEYQDFLLNPPYGSEALVEMAKRLTVGDGVVVLYALTNERPESEEARAIVRAVRETPKIGDGTLLVGGQIATDLDATNYILKRAPRAVGFVVGVTFLMLFLLLGSVVLPLKAVAMNFVSIAGSFGALVWIFQDGHLFIHEPRPLEPAIPVLLFCLIFGLSMDYEVLMLSRIKESYERTRDNTRAVAEGLEKTAGLITSAAAIMVAVFSAFALAKIVLIQSVGVGMALAVAVDATLVRVLLVPATMRLFGDANWWAPKSLLALRKKLGIGDHPH